MAVDIEGAALEVYRVFVSEVVVPIFPSIADPSPALNPIPPVLVDATSW